jgi:hypothetical protein
MNVSDFNASGTMPMLLGRCEIERGVYDGACIYQSYCTQFNSYFIYTGIAVIAVYVFFSWFLWWFLQHGYKKIDWDDVYKNTFAYTLLNGDMREPDVRQWWDTNMRWLVCKFAVGFAGVVVSLSLIRQL